MKYWIYQDNLVKGPYDAAQIAQLKRFNEDTIVCPEGRKGTEMDDWRPARKVPDLLALLAHPQVSTIPDTAAGGSDLHDAINDLSKRLSDLENAFGRIGGLVEDIDRRTEIQAEHRGPLVDKDARYRIDAMESKLSALEMLDQDVKSLREKASSLERGQQDTYSKIGDIETKLSSFDVLDRDMRGFIVKLSGAEKLQKEAQSKISELESKISALESLERDVKLLREKLEAAGHSRTEIKETAPKPPETVELAPLPPPDKKENKIDLLPAPPPIPFKIDAPPSNASEIPMALEPLSLMDVTSPGKPATSPEPFEFLPPTGGMEDPQLPLPPTEEADMATISENNGWTRQQKFAAFGLVILLIPGLLLLIALIGRFGSDNTSDQNTASQAPAASQPRVDPADLSGDALNIVKNYKASLDQDSLEIKLQAAYPKQDKVSPWSVQKIESEDDKYEVIYQVAGRPEYKFLVEPLFQEVQGENTAAASLLNGNQIKAAKPKIKKVQAKAVPAKKKLPEPVKPKPTQHVSEAPKPVDPPVAAAAVVPAQIPTPKVQAPSTRARSSQLSGSTTDHLMGSGPNLAPESAGD